MVVAMVSHAGRQRQRSSRVVLAGLEEVRYM